MTEAKVEISLDSAGRGKVVIDGSEVQDSVSGLHLRADHRGLPRLVLDLVPGATSVSADRSTVVIDSTTRELLTALGWIPPGGGA